MSARIPVLTTRTLDVECERCGQYRITSTLAEFPPRENDLFKYLPAVTRQSYDAGHILRLTTENWQELAQCHQATSVRDKSNKLLRHFGRLAKTPEALFRINANKDYPVLDAISSQEFEYFLDDLRKRGLIMDDFETESREYAGLGQLTKAGWEELRPSGGTLRSPPAPTQAETPDAAPKFDSLISDQKMQAILTKALAGVLHLHQIGRAPRSHGHVQTEMPRNLTQKSLGSVSIARGRVCPNSSS
jgi:hypothetical protein